MSMLHCYHGGVGIFLTRYAGERRLNEKWPSWLKMRLSRSSGHRLGRNGCLYIRRPEAFDPSRCDAEQWQYSGGLDAVVPVRRIRKSDRKSSQWNNDHDRGDSSDEPAIEFEL